MQSDAQMFVVFYETDPVPSQGSAGLIFARVAAGFVYGCLTPLVVSVRVTVPPGLLTGRRPGYGLRTSRLTDAW